MNIALSSYRGHIYPSQGIVLYFSINVLPNAKVQFPGLGALALHFLRTDRRSILDSLDAAQQDIFAKALSATNTSCCVWDNDTTISKSRQLSVREFCLLMMMRTHNSDDQGRID